MGKKIKLILGIAGVLFAIGIGILIWYLYSVQSYKNKVAFLTINNVDLSRIPDGTYVGDCDVDFIYARTEVSVQAGKITDIRLLEHKNGQGKPAEQIINDIMKKQSLDVDAVSGATNSSIVIKKAIENALSGGGITND